MILGFSPAEIFKNLVIERTARDVVKHVVVGPLSNAQQQEGGISIMDAGSGRDELYLPLAHPRLQLRCVGPSLDRSEQIGRHVAAALQDVLRFEVAQDSTGEKYLVHTCTITGPSAHRDTEGTWEYLVFADTMMGTQPIPSD
jgi:hypothetical protein